MMKEKWVDEVDCPSFVKHVDEPKINLIFENSTELEKMVENGGIENLREKVVVFLKVKSTPNQVFVIKELDK